MSVPLKIGIAGLGTVGAGVVQLLQEEAEIIAKRCGRPIEIAGICARDKNRARGVDISPYPWFDSPLALAESQMIDVYVELMGGHEGLARQSVERALSSGKSVVTANKALIAHHGAMLAGLAENQSVALNFEAAVAGGIPVIGALQHGLASNRFTRIAGILNGTCNYILTAMHREKREFADVLKEAQQLGYAEADPSFDVDGIDAAHKLAILTALAFGVQPSLRSIFVEGIRHIDVRDIDYATELGYTIKLLGMAEATPHGILQRVHPCLVPTHAPIARIDGAFNAVQIEGNAVGRILLEGAGAGAGPTASSVLGDIMQIARGATHAPFTLASHHLMPVENASIQLLKSRYYIRLTVLDQPGVLAEVTRIFADELISVEAMIQHDHKPDTPAQVVIMTHVTAEASMQKALQKISSLQTIIKTPQMLRVQHL